MNLKEAYAALGLAEGSTPADAKKAFRKLAQKLHPDINKAPDAEVQFKKINEAYQVIEKGTDNGPTNHQHQQSGYDPIAEFFKNFGGQQKRIVLQDINIQVALKFKDSVIGCKSQIKYERNVKCSPCQGQGKVILNNGCKRCKGLGVIVQRQQNMIMQQVCPDCHGVVSKIDCDSCASTGFNKADTAIEINIPGGVEDGNVLRLSGVGNYGGEAFGQEHYSTVNLHISVAPIEGLKLQDADVVCQANISLLQALTGTKITVPTIDGPQQITVPGATKNNQEVIIPKLGVNRKGNQRVVIGIDYPQDTQPLIDYLKSKEN